MSVPNSSYSINCGRSLLNGIEWRVDLPVAKGKPELRIEDRGLGNARADSSFSGRCKHLLIQYSVNAQIRIIEL